MSDYKLVFFTDDDHDDLNIMREISDSLGHDCKIFHSGVKLMAAIKDLDTRPNIIFLDINMPMVDGYEIIKEIRLSDELKDIPVIVHTGNCDEKCIQKCLNLGATYFITKAFNYADVKSAIEFAINKDWSAHEPSRGNFVHGTN